MVRKCVLVSADNSSRYSFEYSNALIKLDLLSEICLVTLLCTHDAMYEYLSQGNVLFFFSNIKIKPYGIIAHIKI